MDADTAALHFISDDDELGLGADVVHRPYIGLLSLGVLQRQFDSALPIESVPFAVALDFVAEQLETFGPLRVGEEDAGH